ncbi:MAG: hypothetical protein GY779_15880 [Gammaproteobacteria bacterium]|nr:hypothetical protein [Gammaproteobacteria bacterium]
MNIQALYYIARAALLLSCFVSPFTLGATTSAGITPASLSINPSGSVDYSVPLTLPSGINGLTPSLSIDYNSASSGEGQLGVGFSLGGLSIISRCAHNTFQDAMVKPVSFDDTEQRYCIDGSRLIAKDTQHDDYRFLEREYTTTVERYARIVASGRSGNGPAMFRVYKKSGQIFTYGFVESTKYNARILAQGRSDNTIATWALGKIEDRYGNAIKINYTHEPLTGAYRVDRIDYAFTNMQPNASVRFSYNLASDSRIDRYVAGSRADKRALLTAITTVTKNTAKQNIPAKLYSLIYKNSLLSSRHLLTQIQECTGNASTCFKPLHFDWEDAKPGFTRSPISINADNQLWLDSQVSPLDYNGDGYSDLLFFPKNAGKAYLVQGSAAGYKPKRDISKALGFSGVVGEHDKAYVMDYNSDGRADILVAKLSPSGNHLYSWEEDNDGAARHNVTKASFNLSLRLYLSNASSFTEHALFDFTQPLQESTSYSLTSLNYNNDTKPDLLLRTQSHTHQISNNTLVPAHHNDHAWLLRNTFSTGDNVPAMMREPLTDSSWFIKNTHPHVADFNGDGLSDLLMQGKRGKDTFLFVNLNGQFKKLDITSSAQSQYAIARNTWSTHQTHIIDFNGDALTDILLQGTKDSHNTLLLLATGSPLVGREFIAHNITLASGMSGGAWNNEKHAILPIDYNRDGLSDLLLQGMDNHIAPILLKSTGRVPTGAVSAFKKVPIASLGYGQSIQWSAKLFSLVGVDFNNDGFSDIIQKNRINGATKSYVMQTRGTGVDRIRTFSDSLGKKDQITYSTLLDQWTYRASSTALRGDGTRFIKTPLAVVRRVISDAGIVSGKSDTHYHYRDLQMHPEHGMQGFAFVSSSHKLGNILQAQTQTTYYQHFPLTGTAHITRVYKKRANATWYKSSHSSSTVRARQDTNDKHHYFIENTANLSVQYDSVHGEVKRNHTTHSDIDAYGNIQTIITRESSPNDKVTITNRNRYRNYPEQWILGRLVQATAKHTGTGAHFSGSTITRKSSFVYDTQTGSLSDEKRHYPGGKYKNTHYDYDPVYGFISKETVSGSGITTRSTRFEYNSAHHKRFETKTTNALGHSETRTYDLAHGVMTHLTGPNALTTRWTPDPFGRIIKETRADGTFITTKRFQSNIGITDSTFYAHRAPGSVLVQASIASSGQIGATYTDLLGRELRSITWSGVNGTKVVYKDTLYDNQGRVQKTSAPYFYNKPKYYTSITYDQMNRPSSEKLPSGAIVTHRYLKNGVIDTNGEKQSTTRIHNVLGKLISATDANGGRVDYYYNALGNLLTTEQGRHKIHITYDSEGRKIAMDDPDMGRWHYEYNVLDQLVKQRDAKGQSTWFDYDLLGRKVTRYESGPGQGKSAGRKTTWTYDNAQGRGVGKVAKVLGGDLKFQSKHQYDALGRVKRTIRYLNRYNTSTLTPYIDEVFYNAQGRIDSLMNHSTAQRYKNHYSPRGMLTKISRIQASATTPGAGQKFLDLAKALKMRIKPQLTQIEPLKQQIRDKQRAATQSLQASSELFQQAQTLSSEVVTLNEKITLIKDQARAIEQLFATTLPLHINGQVITGFSDPMKRLAHVRKATQYGTLQQQSDTKNTLAQNKAQQGVDKETHANLLTAQIPALQSKLNALEASIRPELSAIENLELSAQRINNGQSPLGEIYWQATSMDASGRISEFSLGNGVSTKQEYDVKSGFLKAIQSSASGLGTFQNLRYTYNKLGTPKSREDKVSGLVESFDYGTENLNRLAKSSITGRVNKTTEYRYDALGNITYKQDNHCTNTINTACYEYASKAHAVTSAGGTNYHYDANGNMISSGAGRLISWTHFNKPRTLTQSARSSDEKNRSLSFDYDAQHQRIRTVQIDDTQHDNTNGVTTTTWSLGAGYQQIVKPGPVIEHHQSIKVPGASIVIVQHESQNGSLKGESIAYLHHDNLGSTNVISARDINNRAIIIERSHFDAFGAALKEQSRVRKTTNSKHTNKGYTGHEMLTAFGLVHMNARLYDPVLGRFISPDTFVQSKANTQALNRYSYVLNNPLSYTDPSGHFFISLASSAGSLWFANEVYHWGQDHPQQAAIIAATTFTGGAALAYGTPVWAAGALAGGVGGGLSVKLNAGNDRDVFAGVLKGAIIGGTSTGLAQVGTPLLVQGIFSGTASEVQGGEFMEGFISAGIMTGAAQHKLNTVLGDNSAGRIIMKAAMKGTASKLSGSGCFTNGAYSATFVQLFNEMPGLYKRTVGYALNAYPGGATVEKGPLGMPVKGANNIGTQDVWRFDSNGLRIISTFEEGSRISRFANQIPGINAVGGMHDVFQVSMGNSFLRDALNIPGMVVAAGITYSGFIGEIMNNTPDYWYVSINMSESRYKRRIYE